MTKKATGGRRADDGALALRFFDAALGGPSWAAWRAFVCGLFGVPMSEAEAATFKQLTGRVDLPTTPAREAWIIAGRRSGKTRVVAFLTAFFAGVKHWTLAPGERGVVQVITPSRRQATVLIDYAEAFLQMIPGVEIVRRTLDTIELANGLSIAVQTASFRTPRGFTVVAGIIDEIAFLRSDDMAANPDTEILRAVRPSLASVPGSLLIALSSPHAQRGELAKTYEKHYGRQTDVLVVQSDTRTLNPTIPQRLINQAYQDDPASAAAEWGGLFRADLEALYGKEALEAVVVRGRFEMPPAPGIAYVGFVDPSGGSADSFTLAIAHRDTAGMPVLDLVREVRPPFSPERTVAEFAKDLKRYGVSKVSGDRYGGEWPREQFANHKIAYEVAELTRSELYLELLPLVNSGSAQFLDHTRMLGQFAGLERRVGRSGKDSVDHRPGSHDDVANAAAGALVHALRSDDFATLPDAFKSCYRAASIPSFRLHDCYLFGGRFKPVHDVCCGNCPGHSFVRAAVKAHEERTGERPYWVQFYRERIRPNDLVSRVKAQAWANAMGI